MSVKRIRKAVIPAAGLGTRVLPATKAQPKEMLTVVDTPSIQYIVEEAIASGIEDILIVTGRNKRAIEDHFDRSIELELLLTKKNYTDLLDRQKLITEDNHSSANKKKSNTRHNLFCTTCLENKIFFPYLCIRIYFKS